MVIFGPASAFPHGSAADRYLKLGDVVLVDGGCRIEGYQSDVTRTVIFGKPSEKHMRVWEIVKKAHTVSAGGPPFANCHDTIPSSPTPVRSVQEITGFLRMPGATGGCACSLSPEVAMI